MADRVTVIGWDGSPLTDVARSALAAATLVAGAAHHLALPEVPPHAERIRLGSASLAARRIARHRGSAVVLADGDPGFFGVVRTLRAPEHGLEVEVVPAVSSVAAAFARAGMPWDDAQLVVAHSRTLRRAVNVCRAHNKVAVLTSPGAGPAELALLLTGVHRTFVICEALGTDREEVTVLTSDKVADHTWRDPNVVIVVGGTGAGAATGTTQGSGWLAGHDVGYPPAVRGWALPMTEYAGQSAEATGGARAGESAQLRAAQLARLGPRIGDLVWDIGAGSGALAVEAARFGAAVIAVDADADACARTYAAARRFGVQLEPVHGVAPHVLEDLPEPDVVRVGGGGVVTVTAVADRRPARIVTHAGTRDEAEALGRALAEGGYAVECALLQSVELDTEEWAETERAVVFLLSGVRI
ncbi:MULTISPECIES: precorrin-6y C5,15-methyltransferase (decarboxylating) subunit CbiE [unclassified Streptomyces]|uniref:precorrin-6y C5,15-methyltransferase (decarboxylating) subunit CbiE n=1 Tax=unclassified Streptomyces TaxID=2593676 RepID=UPI002DD8D1BD|nr:precorrin-6y C5,15-methyltransferase (decarboxylating) subunit CbiE [Streptomyces sp. NBC_01795]WSA96265.1 precorrin-6y C5,15-methyltransferase (decarboxylating) subunit CbiE [Streptomyces sp. NBC_01795]WSS39821.1 precorrin-6y C5,15-methyltransferase (decarboxylating) subunit CbiE [Streptomyces sp. NBC_01187]